MARFGRRSDPARDFRAVSCNYGPMAALGDWVLRCILLGYGLAGSRPAYISADLGFARLSLHHIGIWHGRVHVLRSEEHTSELQSLMRISYAVICLKKKKIQ